MSTSIILGDARERLTELPAESVHCVATSPPYFGLRDYGVAGQMGLEPDYREYVATLVAVFREARRVLRADGTVWLNLGDSYAGASVVSWRPGNPDKNNGNSNRDGVGTVAGLKPKDLCGIPWRVAFALQEDGWYLRQDIIWSKPNPMPESVTDRCTKAHEYVFLLSKSARYYFDAEAIAGPCAQSSLTAHAGRPASGVGPRVLDTSPPWHPTQSHPDKHHNGRGLGNGGARDLSRSNKRSVWTIATAPFPEAHFATFPPALIEPCILAGCPRGGTVLDPFFGAGTTGLVADRLGRNCIGIELNPAYAAMAERRIHADAGMFADLSICPKNVRITPVFVRIMPSTTAASVNEINNL